MSNTDDMKNKAHDALGQVKETVGSAFDDASTKGESMIDQASAKAKEAGNSVKDKTQEMLGKISK